VRRAVGRLSYDEAVRRLRERDVGFTEVVPVERVLEAPQARQPGKLRTLSFRELQFEVPEFPGQTESEPGLPPPQLGEHTVEILRSLGFDEGQCAALLDRRAVKEAGADEFAWADVRRGG
jgi:crotonobetainyl-CoA:carnitine CoA-transferase CaiB-like acyl-CoA transferase